MVVVTKDISSMDCFAIASLTRESTWAERSFDSMSALTMVAAVVDLRGFTIDSNASVNSSMPDSAIGPRVFSAVSSSD